MVDWDACPAVTIAGKGTLDVPPGTLKSILKQAGLGEGE